MSLKRGTSLAALVLCLGVASTVALQAIGQDGAKNAQEEWKAPGRASKRKNPVSADEKSLAAGKAIYVRDCLSCHGAAGKGDGPAAKDLPKKSGDLSDPKMWEQSDGALFWKISEGKAPMTGYEKMLGEEDRWHVVNYLRTLAPKPKEGVK